MPSSRRGLPTQKQVPGCPKAEQPGLLGALRLSDRRPRPFDLLRHQVQKAQRPPRRDPHRLWRQPGPHSIRRRLRQTLRHRADAGLVRNDEPPPAITGRASTGQWCALTGGHCPHAFSRTHHHLCHPEVGRRPHEEGPHPLPQLLRGQGGIPACDGRPSISHGADFLSLKGRLDL